MQQSLLLKYYDTILTSSLIAQAYFNTLIEVIHFVDPAIQMLLLLSFYYISTLQLNSKLPWQKNENLKRIGRFLYLRICHFNLFLFT